MDIHAFVKPKHEVIFVHDDMSMREALEKMGKYRYTAIPILSRASAYVGTLTEGDLLWKIMNMDHFTLERAEKIPVADIPRLRDYVAINVKANIDELILRASDANFVPIVDDNGRFLGIVTRKTLLNYFFEHNFIVL
jgi:CBS domain-containing protein